VLQGGAANGSAGKTSRDASERRKWKVLGCWGGEKTPRDPEVPDLEKSNVVRLSRGAGKLALKPKPKWEDLSKSRSKKKWIEQKAAKNVRGDLDQKQKPGHRRKDRMYRDLGRVKKCSRGHTHNSCEELQWQNSQR